MDGNEFRNTLALQAKLLDVIKAVADGTTVIPDPPLILSALVQPGVFDTSRFTDCDAVRLTLFTVLLESDPTVALDHAALVEVDNIVALLISIVAAARDTEPASTAAALLERYPIAQRVYVSTLQERLKLPCAGPSNADIGVRMLRQGVAGATLVRLPYHFDVLMSWMCRRTCRRCLKRAQTPVLCLVCGVFMCGGRAVRVLGVSVFLDLPAGVCAANVLPDVRSRRSHSTV